MFRKFIVYLRVSTTKQGASGLGLEAQREAVERYAQAVGGVILDCHVEVESGKVRERPVLATAIARCRQAGATLLIAKLDRLSRSVHFITGLMEAKVPFLAVDMPMATPLVLHVMAAFAEHEREMISARTRAALAAAKARGVQLGKNGARLAAQNRADAQAFASNLASVMGEVRSGGASTLREIADALNERGLRSREGICWSPETVRRLIARLATPSFGQHGVADVPAL